MKTFIMSLYAVLLFSGCQTFFPAVEGNSAALQGMVYGGDQEPVKHATVSILRNNEEDWWEISAQTQTDINGRFTFAGMRYDNYTIQIEKENYESVELTLDWFTPNQVIYVKTWSMEQLQSQMEEALAQGNWQEVALMKERADSVEAGDPVVAYLWAIHFYKQSQYDEAVQILEPLLLEADGAVYIHLALGSIARAQRQPEKEMMHLQEATLRQRLPEAEERLRALQSSLNPPVEAVLESEVMSAGPSGGETNPALSVEVDGVPDDQTPLVDPLEGVNPGMNSSESEPIAN